MTDLDPLAITEMPTTCTKHGCGGAVRRSGGFMKCVTCGVSYGPCFALQALHAKQQARRAHRDVERIMRDEPTIIHPLARARGVTHDDICEGMSCTIRLASFNEGPAIITDVEHTKHGRAWRVRVRPEFDAIAARYQRSWSFTLSDAIAVKAAPISRSGLVRHPFFAYRHGSIAHDPLMWQHRRLLLGHGAARDEDLTSMIAATRLGFVPRTFKDVPAALRDDHKIDEFYACTVFGIGRFLKSRGIGAATPDTLDSLLGRADQPATAPRCP